MMIQQITCFCENISRRNLIQIRGEKLPACGILPGCLGNLRHIIGSGHMGLIRKSVWVIKMCIGTSQLLGSGIHQFHKFLHRTGNLFSNGQCHLVGRFQHQSHKSLLHGENLSRITINGRASCLNSISCLLG